MIPRAFDRPSAIAEFVRLKEETEALWAATDPDLAVYGYEIQRGTRWNPGLREEEIDAYERALGVRFPARFRCMLAVMNGTDLPTVNVYGSSGYPRSEWVGVYAYPRDLDIVRDQVDVVRQDHAEVARALADEEFRLDADMGLVPVYGHRYLVCGADPLDGPVLSIYGTDAIVYCPDLLSYLRAELLEHR
jgi:hypothetical protein